MNRFAGVIALVLGLSVWGVRAATDATYGAAVPQLINVWPGVAPGAETWEQKETESKLFGGDRIIRNVVNPTIEVFQPKPDKANGTAIVICPGGAFRFLSIDSEGTQVAQWFASKGVAAFLLRYRLVKTAESDALFTAQIFTTLAPLFRSGDALVNDMKKNGPPAVADGRQALKYLREHSSEFGFSADRLGILGFSAGGVVATGAATEYDAASRPDFFAAVYPGAWPIEKVPEDAPPLFIAAADDDSITPFGAKPLEAAWKAAGKPVEMHRYATGGHGFGMKQQGKPSDAWTEHLLAWIGGLGLLKPVK